MLTQEEIQSFHEKGFLRLEQVYSPDEIGAMSEELDYLIQTFATWEAAWPGPWRGEYAPGQEDSVKLVFIQELHLYSSSWARGVMNPRLAGALSALLDSDAVELHHSNLHAKPPSAGAPFPMHQDFVFFPHGDGRLILALVHLDDADEARGCIKFLPGSHKLGPVKHIIGTRWAPPWPQHILEHHLRMFQPYGEFIDSDTPPYLPTDQYPLQDAVSVHAKAGDVVLFHLWTAHYSAVNQSGHWRRVVRVGYRHPASRQTSGEFMGRPGVIVRGIRPPVEGLQINVYGHWTPPE